MNLLELLKDLYWSEQLLNLKILLLIHLLMGKSKTIKSMIVFD